MDLKLEEERKKMITLVKEASLRWQEAFNRGDAQECANQYDEDAIMHPYPFELMHGKENIKQFWQKLIDQGHKNVEYKKSHYHPIDGRKCYLFSEWTMNKAKGLIMKEVWIANEDRTSAKLSEDYFAVYDEKSTPNDLRKKEIIEAVQKASALWREGFNKGSSTQCAAAYSVNSEMIARPFGSTKFGRTDIRDFWKNLISQGFSDVKYIDTEIIPLSNDLAALNAKWTMNNAKGEIYHELFRIADDGKAYIELDHFEALP
ncbi:MAG: hypothetical protein MHPSP_003350 [Paramarteilia canceri]